VRSIAGWLPREVPSETHGGRATAVADEVTSLFVQFRSPVLRYLRSLGLSTEDSEDVLQEAFLALFRHLWGNKSREHLRGWIFRTSHNLALKCRAQKSRYSGELDESSRVDPDLNPEEQLAWSQSQDRIARIFQALSERDRCCLNLRAEGLRYREISEVLGMSLGAVALSLSRSLARFSSAEEGAGRDV
jgi:RNA polymerase sigma-70 factor, ECF subfamily